MVMITRNGHSLPLLLILVETSNLLFDRSVCFAEPADVMNLDLESIIVAFLLAFDVYLIKK